jgi:hypothetical protein
LPEVSLCQHISGIHYLWWAKHNLFNDKGSITYKQGSDATFTYQLSHSETLADLFIPWYKENVVPFLHDDGLNHFNHWLQILELRKTLREWNLKDAETCAKLTYSLNSKKGRNRKLSLDELLTNLKTNALSQ